MRYISFWRPAKPCCRCIIKWAEVKQTTQRMWMWMRNWNMEFLHFAQNEETFVFFHMDKFNCWAWWGRKMEECDSRECLRNFLSINEIRAFESFKPLISSYAVNNWMKWEKQNFRINFYVFVVVVAKCDFSYCRYCSFEKDIVGWIPSYEMSAELQSELRSLLSMVVRMCP